MKSAPDQFRTLGIKTRPRGVHYGRLRNLLSLRLKPGDASILVLWRRLPASRSKNTCARSMTPTGSTWTGSLWSATWGNISRSEAGRREYTGPMATFTSVPVEEYLRTFYDPDREYVDGQLVERHVGEYFQIGSRETRVYWSYGDVYQRPGRRIPAHVL